jgi:hypothetical protein
MNGDTTKTESPGSAALSEEQLEAVTGGWGQLSPIASKFGESIASLGRGVASVATDVAATIKDKL